MSPTVEHVRGGGGGHLMLNVTFRRHGELPTAMVTRLALHKTLRGAGARCYIQRRCIHTYTHTRHMGGRVLHVKCFTDAFYVPEYR